MSENRKRELVLVYSSDDEVKRVKIKEMCTWDKLPNELKVMCIEKTDFKTRANLMLSNRHNKMLVESIKSKYPLSYVRFFATSSTPGQPDNFGFAVKSWRSKADYVSDKFELRKFIDVLSKSKIDELDVQISGKNAEDRDYELSRKLWKTVQKLSFKSIRVVWKEINEFESSLVEICDEHLEHISVSFDRSFSYFNLENLLSYDQTKAAKRLTFCERNGGRKVHRQKAKIIVNWMLFNEKVDHNIGKEVIIEKGRPLWEWFVAKVEEKIAFRHPTEKMLCLRLQNAEKQMWAWLAEPNGSLNFLVSAAGSEAPNVKEIQKQRAKERKEYLLKTKLGFIC